MLRNRNIQIFGMAVLMIAVTQVIILACSPSTPASVSDDNAIIPVTGGYQGLDQYYHSERGMYTAPVQYGLEIYHQSDRMQAVNWTNSSDPLYQYHQSEWFGT